MPKEKRESRRKKDEAPETASPEKKEWGRMTSKNEKYQILGGRKKTHKNESIKK